MEWAVAIAAFLASAVEFVEAFTIVLVVGVTINWRSAMIGTLAAVASLALLIAIFGVALVQYVPIDIFRLVVGVILVLFGLKWLKKAILRYSGIKALHDEEAIYEDTIAELRAKGEVVTTGVQPSAVALAFKSVLLEGLEVAFIVITFGSNATASAATGRFGGIFSAAIGATVAGLLVIALGLIVRAPLKQVPENTLKFVVGIMLTSFGTFWAIEGFNVEWPLADAFIPVIGIIYLAASFVLINWLRNMKQHQSLIKQAQVAQAEQAQPLEEVL
ncbi:MAG: hypothetical protein NVS2B12_23400 [Ktedonobacteraceae bacterium]